MDGGTVTITFKGDDKDLEKKVNSVKADLTDSLGSVKNIVAGMGITQLIGKAFNTLNANLDGAITRLDTMNNFPKVMKNLGINVEESEKAISKLSDKLTGLPTTLDSATISVQRLTSKNGDLEKSTDIFLAMNNAIIAGGANATIQSSAVEQLTQAYSKGKMDMMEWRTLQMAMPAQLKQVASAMGLEVDGLGEMMRQGDNTQETINEFVETIIKLNSEGVDGFANFEEQARGSVSGIGTSITNMKTAIVRGTANMLKGLNDGLTKAKLPTISEMIQIITQKINEVFKSVSSFLSNIKWQKIISFLKKSMPLIIGIFTGLMAYKTITGVITAVKTAMLLLNAVMAMNPIMLVVIAISALVGAFIYLWNTSEDFRNFWIGLWEGIKNTAFSVIEWFKSIPESIGNVVNSIINFLSNLPYYFGYMIGFIAGTIYKFWTEDVPNFVNGVIQWFSELPGRLWNIITDIVGKVGQWFSDMWNKAKEEVPKLINNIVNWFKELPGKMIEIGSNIVSGIWQGITNRANKFKNDVRNFFGGIVDGVKDVLGIRSPSKEFAIIGKYSILGYTEALDDMKSNVQNIIDDVFGIDPTMYNNASTHFSPNINMTVVNNMDFDPIGQVVNKVKTYSGGSKNDYSYGQGVS